MDVKIMRAPEDPELTIFDAAHMCYSDGRALELDHDRKIRLINKLLKDGHLSPFEHVSITYQIDGISRACSHQLVRHRLASYTQQSQRYVTLDEEPQWVIPPRYQDNWGFRQSLYYQWRDYCDLVEYGDPPEDARYLLPNATPTSIVVTMNFRELLHFFELRCCKRAQWEIRDLANKMLKLAQGIAPNVFGNAGAPCTTCRQECPDEMV